MPEDKQGNVQTVGTSSKTYAPGVMGLSQQLADRGLQSPEALAMLQQNATNRNNDSVLGAMYTNNRNAVGNIAAGLDKWSPTQGLEDFASGKYLSPETNPYLKGMYDDAANSVMSQLRGQFAGAGRYGSGAMAATQGDTLNRLANTLYGNAYQSGMQNMFGANTAINQGNLQGRNQQLAAAALFPSMAVGGDAQLAQLAGLQQNAINSQYAGIANLLGQGSTGTTGTQQTPYFSNDLANGLGAAGGFLSLGNGLLNLGGKVGDLFSGWGGGGGAGFSGDANWGGTFGSSANYGLPTTDAGAGSFFGIPEVPAYNFSFE